MDFGTNMSLETRQVLSQRQVESLNILSMPLTELHDFLQNEEIENPLMEYAMADASGLPGTDGDGYAVRDAESFYGKRKNDGDESGNMEQFLSQMEDEDFSVQDFVMQQISAGNMTKEELKAASYAVLCLDERGFLTAKEEEIAAGAGVSLETARVCLQKLKELEPAGIFASDLKECLKIQVRGMDGEEMLSKLIEDHLEDIAGGKIAVITRATGLTSVQVRKMIAVIRGLNPRPLNGFSGGKTEYVIPDISFKYGDGQWVVELGSRYGGQVGINEFYLKMMDEARDKELKEYFQQKLKRVRFIMNAVEQRRTTLTRIAGYILKKQEKYFLNQGPLKPMTIDETAEAVSLNKSTVSRAVKDKYVASPRGCLAMRKLFTTASGDGDVSRNTVKERLKALVDAEDKSAPLSDEKLAGLLKEQGLDISRRTAAKYRTELGIPGAFSRREL